MKFLGSFFNQVMFDISGDADHAEHGLFCPVEPTEQLGGQSGHC